MTPQEADKFTKIKIGNWYKDNLGRTNVIVRKVDNEENELKGYWELECVAWDDCPHNGEPRHNTFWKSGQYILENYVFLPPNKLTNKTMIKITNLVKKILDVDTRILIKAGFIDGNLSITEEGTSELLSLVFLEKKEELVKIAEEKNAETNR